MSGTKYPSSPTEPATAARAASKTPPGTCHQTAAATTTASAIRNSPAPSRRCSGSRSRAPWPTRRAPDPMPPATPSQTAVIPWPRPAKVRETGPGPLRTARGAGRRFLLAPFFAGGLRLLWLPDGRDREVEAPFVLVLLLRDAGGEDVRVAMVAMYPPAPPAPRVPRRVFHTSRIRTFSPDRQAGSASV